MKTTIELAREAGFEASRAHGLLPHVPEDIFIANVCVTEEVKRLVALVRADEREIVMNEPLTKAQWQRFEDEIRADEREACLSVIKPNATPMEIAAAIRARGNT
jgi:hypothetical protein